LRALGGGRVVAVNVDVTTPDGQDALLAACPQPDILVNSATGRSRRVSEREAGGRPAALARNMIAPLLLTQRVLPGMIAAQFGRIITSIRHGDDAAPT